MILLPGETGIAESRQLETPPDDDVKARIASLCGTARSYGVILRRTGGAASDLAGAVAAGIAGWRLVGCEVATTGCVYHGGDLAARVRRAFPSVQIETVTPDQADAFDAEWDEVVAATRRSEVRLAGGGRLWIEPTRA